MAHEMIARYTVLDKDAKRLILLRPYQIHAIESIREASKTGKSGFVWHTTGSGKTLTSYKATRNLLMDIPTIDKAIFLIDRKDLDTQTTMAFQAYANHDLVDVDETDNVNDLKKKLKSGDRQEPKGSWNDFLDDHYGMDLLEHHVSQKIRILRWEICHVRLRNYMEKYFIVIRFRMLFMIRRYWNSR